MRFKGIEFRNVTSNSKDVRKGDLFVAIKGSKFDGHDFVEEAFKRGAVAAVVESQKIKAKGIPPKAGSRRISKEETSYGKNIIEVKDTHEVLSTLAAEFYGHPADRMKIVGITGTNGKTTICLLADRIIADAGYKTGVVGTIFYRVGKRKVEADRTTPDALRINNFLRQMAKIKTDYVIMEVSSHALEQKRVNDIYYDAALFANISREHLDYHKNIRSYFEAKAKIFNNLRWNGCAILNRDEKRTEILLKRIKQRIITYGIYNNADIMANEIASDVHGSRFKVTTPKYTLNINTRLLGTHNVSNILAAVSIAYFFRLNPKEIEKSIQNFHNVPGRLEKVVLGQDFSIFIDYAHTEDALKNVLLTLKKYAERKIITVFGCGGERDRTKRPRMGKLSTELSDFTVITTDNPRGESPKRIAEEIERGINPRTANYCIILDREKAIRKALETAKKDDVVLIAGKGHETEQIVDGASFKFNDREVTEKMLKRMKKI